MMPARSSTRFASLKRAARQYWQRYLGSRRSWLGLPAARRQTAPAGPAAGSGVRVHLYALCWNDAYMLPYFFRHYDSFVDRYIIFDDGSTDRSLDILRRHP